MLFVPYRGGCCVKAELVRRRDRFTVDVALFDPTTGDRMEGVEEAHCINPGRMEGFVRPGAEVYLSLCMTNRSGRKSPWTLELVCLDGLVCSVNTLRPNEIVGALLSARKCPALEWLEMAAEKSPPREYGDVPLGTSRRRRKRARTNCSPAAQETCETPQSSPPLFASASEYFEIDLFPKSSRSNSDGQALPHRCRFDFWLRELPSRQDHWVEVKNCHLVTDGWGYFPDSVSARATRHLRELHLLVQHGHRATMVFVVQRADVEEERGVRPSDFHDPEFAATCREVGWTPFVAGGQESGACPRSGGYRTNGSGGTSGGGGGSGSGGCGSGGRAAAPAGGRGRVTLRALKVACGPEGAWVLGEVPVDLAPYDTAPSAAAWAAARPNSGWLRTFESSGPVADPSAWRQVANGPFAHNAKSSSTSNDGRSCGASASTGPRAQLSSPHWAGTQQPGQAAVASMSRFFSGAVSLTPPPCVCECKHTAQAPHKHPEYLSSG